MKKVIGAILLVLLATTAAILPWRELWSAAQFVIAPEVAKTAHMVRLRNAERQALTVIGTVHYRHIETTSYPLWELKAILATLKPTMVFVEERPESIAAGAWGEGPVEMPFCAFVAKEMGIAVRGMDDWSQDFSTREDKMVVNVLDHLPATGDAVVMTGSSHVPGFTARLTRRGFVLDEWSEDERRTALKTTVEHTYPPGLLAAYLTAIELAEAAKGPFDAGWAARRRPFVATIP